MRQSLIQLEHAVRASEFGQHAAAPREEHVGRGVGGHLHREFLLVGIVGERLDLDINPRMSRFKSLHGRRQDLLRPLVVHDMPKRQLDGFLLLGALAATDKEPHGQDER